jgi:hypothetical protein
MVIERTSTEYIIRIPITTSITDVQDFLNYLRYKQITSKFVASQALVDELVADTKNAWRAKRQKSKA